MNKNTITVDGETYTKRIKQGPLTMVVLDKGFIFVGKLDDTAEYWRLTDVQNVRSWDKGGFWGLALGAKASGATLDPTADITFLDYVFLGELPEGWEEL